MPSALRPRARSALQSSEPRSRFGRRGGARDLLLFVIADHGMPDDRRRTEDVKGRRKALGRRAMAGVLGRAENPNGGSFCVVVLHHLSSLHHELDMLEYGDVLEGVALHRNNVSPLAGLKGSDLVRPPQ